MQNGRINQILEWSASALTSRPLKEGGMGRERGGPINRTLQIVNAGSMTLEFILKNQFFF